MRRFWSVSLLLFAGLILFIIIQSLYDSVEIYQIFRDTSSFSPANFSLPSPLPHELFHHSHVIGLSALAEPHSHIYRNTLTLMPINSGMLTLAKNALCSLAHIDPTLITRLTIWAMNEGVINELQEWNRRNELVYNATAYPQDNQQTAPNPSIIPVHGYSIFYDSNYVGVSEMRQNGGVEYRQLMQLRKSLYVYIIEKLNLFFMDGDLVFLDDPYKDIGISNDFAAYKEKASKETMLPPDLVYAVDPRDHYYWQRDPYEGETFVPKICGCLFWAKSNNRTLKVMKQLEKHPRDDQHGMNAILNSPEGHCTVLIDPLPHGLPRRSVNRKDCPPEDRLRMRVLDLGKYANGRLVWKKKRHYKSILKSMKSNGENPVFVHPNVWEAGFNKVEALKEEGFWFLDDDEMCKA